MTIAIDIIGTNLGSGTKTYNINFCNEINSLNLNSNIIIFICRSYLNQIEKKQSDFNMVSIWFNYFESRSTIDCQRFDIDWVIIKKYAIII